MPYKICQICQNSRIKKKLGNKYDVVERTTSCRLVLGGGTVLKVNEVQIKEDEESRRKNLTCLCQVSSSEIQKYSKSKKPAASGIPSYNKIKSDKNAGAPKNNKTNEGSKIKNKKLSANAKPR